MIRCSKKEKKIRERHLEKVCRSICLQILIVIMLFNLSVQVNAKELTITEDDICCSEDMNEIEELYNLRRELALPTSNTTTWTSTRQVTMYNGKSYQLQIIRAIPKTSNSNLLGSNLSYSKYNSGFL